MCRAQRVLDDVPDRLEEDEPDGHPRDEAEGHLDHPVPQLAQVIEQRHPALGVLPPLRAHVPLADDTGALDGTGEFRHDRFRQKA
jgi:hypothetical protein